jgi:hypothetical protein
LGDDQTFTVADTTTGDQLIGQFAVKQGSTRAGRNVVLQPSGSVDEQASLDAPWVRGGPSGAVDVGLSTNGHVLATLAAPGGNARVTTNGAAAEQPLCPGSDVATAVASSGPSGTLASAVADTGVVAATALTPSDSGPRPAGCIVPSHGSPYPILSLAGERLRAVDVSADGQYVVIGGDVGGAGTITVYATEAGLKAATRSTATGIAAVAMTSGDTPVVVAADTSGEMNALQVRVVDNQPDSSFVPRCAAPTTTDPVTVIAVGKGSDGSDLAAVTTGKAVLVYRIGDKCDKIGGFDLLRDEGQIIDLAFDDSGHLTTLGSDLSVFRFDPLQTAAAVAGDVAQRANARGWVLTDSDCKDLLGTPKCPA